MRFYNSMTRQKEDFVPLEEGKVKMYVCGVTPYDHCHIGHARCYTVFDAVLRHLRASGYDVEYVRNITDIEDKIIKRANENGESIGELSGRYIDAMYEDFDALGILRPDREPKATEYMPQMIEMIERLIERGHAYAADNGDVYYAVGTFADYGKLSGKKLEDLRAGARVEVDEAKKDPVDFVLWKAAKPGEPSWDSPWGKGRPGWHIECSAMSRDCLGEAFDIHGGGMDLKFPHHENEIAQSCGAHDAPFVKHWLHNGFVNIDEEKMSKSLGNFFTIRDVLKSYRAEVIRFFLLGSHYRSPLNYSNENLDKAAAGIERLYLAARGEVAEGHPGEYRERFLAAMDDDLNTPMAISVLFELASAINTASDPEEQAGLRGELLSLAGRLGLLRESPEEFLRGGGDDDDAERIEGLIAERKAARDAKDFAEADRIRDMLAAEGVILDDGPEGTTWRRGR
ncbi:MAG: cysteine--tRNA ligase [Gammaproteobacteria bacterium]|nr:cysteine--tRNA ligase [Gammaproteobacteria bacterium]